MDFTKYFWIIIIIMLVQNHHVPLKLKAEKRRIALSDGNPLVLVLSEDFNFLNIFTEKILQLHDYPFVIRRANGRELMDYTLPLICYEDIILSNESLIGFICDIALSHLEITEYIERKDNIIQIYRSWFDIFSNQTKYLTKGDLSSLTKNDINNRIYELLLTFSRQIVHKGYEKIFQSYRDGDVNIEAILMMDITETILKNCPREVCDYALRGDFSQQIDFVQNYKNRLEMEKPIRMQEGEGKFILMNPKKEVEQNFPKLHLNLKWFSGVLVGLAFIFGKWAR